MRTLRGLSKWQLISLAGAAVALLLIIVDFGFYLRPGPVESLVGLAQHLFVLVVLLAITASTRTVSIPALGAFWLVGVFPDVLFVLALTWIPADMLGTGANSIVPTVIVPIVDVVAYLLPVAAYYFFLGRGNNLQAAASDGLLIGFAVGAGYAFHEDAFIGELSNSGHGWLATQPWSLLAPTVSPIGADGLGLNHGLWAALCGLSLGIAILFRHRRFAWLIALVGPALAVLNHGLFNTLASDPFLGAGRGTMPPVASLVDQVTVSGKLVLLTVFVGAIVVVFLERRILRWVAAGVSRYPPVSVAMLGQLLVQARGAAGLGRFMAASRYALFRRLVYFAVWRDERAAVDPTEAGDTLRGLSELAGQAGLHQQPQPVMAAEAVT